MSPTSALRLTGEMIAVASRGELVRGSGVSADEGACIDSRIARPSQVFFAIRGPRFDGHDFLAQTLEKGVTGLVVRGDRAAEAMALASACGDSVFVVAVDDPQAALIETATAWVSMLSPRVVAITGSVGKTTVKDMVQQVVATRFQTHATRGNQNNVLGTSLTCLGLLPRHEVMVVEMGMSALGEIAALCRIAPPTIGVVTCVAPVHLETLGSLDRIAQAKAEMVEALPIDGCAVLNADDPRVRAMAASTRAPTVLFGKADDARVRLIDVTLEAGGFPAVRLRVDGRDLRGRLGLVGAHHGINAAAAVAAGLAMEIPPEEALAALETVRPGHHRMQEVVAGTIRILDDCYNASPLSMEAALETLAAVAPGRRVAVIGDMRELGAIASTAHWQVGHQAARQKVDVLIAIGEFRGLVREGAVAGGMAPSQVFEAEDAIAGATLALVMVQPRDTVLVKASRALGLERVVEALARRFQSDGNSKGE
ncbi:MAG TPA: UDP-N-acetylmuramoyl-tripeptide--D-alanyl-D-alanine ligase [Myxococcota bacterium]|nr:UDP-N-acetylmuramoyl-tripeptide--D-alanyl-D-alanine ligase [Myxococcota bacterium]HQK49612.1 UDP-N-acetylmuramoyl-tripeptide--D-alanyl-D-alanine ligase [Myxococcota bacterium]